MSKTLIGRFGDCQHSTTYTKAFATRDRQMVLWLIGAKLVDSVSVPCQLTGFLSRRVWAFMQKVSTGSQLQQVHDLGNPSTKWSNVSQILQLWW
jgi:hypothetical protein